MSNSWLSSSSLSLSLKVLDKVWWFGSIDRIASRGKVSFLFSPLLVYDDNVCQGWRLTCYSPYFQPLQSVGLSTNNRPKVSVAAHPSNWPIESSSVDRQQAELLISTLSTLSKKRRGWHFAQLYDGSIHFVGDRFNPCPTDNMAESHHFLDSRGISFQFLRRKK